jgi:hypothetical protein
LVRPFHIVLGRFDRRPGRCPALIIEGRARRAQVEIVSLDPPSMIDLLSHSSRTRSKSTMQDSTTSFGGGDVFLGEIQKSKPKEGKTPGSQEPVSSTSVLAAIDRYLGRSSRRRAIMAAARPLSEGQKDAVEADEEMEYLAAGELADAIVGHCGSPGPCYVFLDVRDGRRWLVMPPGLLLEDGAGAALGIEVEALDGRVLAFSPGREVVIPSTKIDWELPDTFAISVGDDGTATLRPLPASGSRTESDEAEDEVEADEAEDDPGPIRFTATNTGPHLIDVLTYQEWSRLSPDVEPESYFRHRADCYVRVTTVARD